MKEYGGYLELERFGGEEYHTGCVALNCGRNALAYLIKAKGIRKLAVPYFLCGCVAQICETYGVPVRYYHTGMDFMPDDGPPGPDESVYVANYYGQLDETSIRRLMRIYGNRMIVDNVQAFFQKPVDGVDTIYGCRKFFGVPDGAYLYTDVKPGGGILPRDESFGRMGYLLGRYERPAGEFYQEYVKLNESFAKEPVMEMSKLTKNLLRGIDYETVKEKRTANFRLLHSRLSAFNRLCPHSPEGAFMYPLLVENGESIRRRLQRQKIYIPTLWPDVYDLCGRDSTEYNLAQNILPLPVDQRYGPDDMEELADKAAAEIMA